MFSAAGFLVLYLIQRIQGHLPLNPIALKGVRPDIAMNTAISFVTNTNWQAYVPETTMSYLTQAAGLAVQNFVSAATGMAVAVALIRGFTRSQRDGIGNFWADLVRGTLYILVPISFVIGDRARRPRRRHDVRRAGARDDARGCLADDHARPGREPGGDQAARHERRRVLQRELRAPVRVEHAVHGLPAASRRCSLIPFSFPFLYGRMLGRLKEGLAIIAAMLILIGAGFADLARAPRPARRRR